VTQAPKVVEADGDRAGALGERPVQIHAQACDRCQLDHVHGVDARVVKRCSAAPTRP